MGASHEVEVRGARLSVRPLRSDEVPHVVAYFRDASPADHERMGIDLTRFPSAEALTLALEAAIGDRSGAPRSFYTAWLVDGKPIGFSSLKNIEAGRAEMHLHVWSPAHRGQGFGAVLFCLAALDGIERFRLEEIVCEPKATNPMPNRMLQKVGFHLLGQRFGASSEISTTTTLNRYRIDAGTAMAYLRRVADGPQAGGDEEAMTGDAPGAFRSPSSPAARSD